MRRGREGALAAAALLAAGELAARGLKAWRDRGYPPTPRYPAPSKK